MKIAISLPDELFREIDSCARRLRIPRSRLIADGARLIVQKRRAVDATAAWDAALEAAGIDREEPAIKELRRRSKRAVHRASGAW